MTPPRPALSDPAAARRRAEIPAAHPDRAADYAFAAERELLAILDRAEPGCTEPRHPSCAALRSSLIPRRREVAAILAAAIEAWLEQPCFGARQ
jgi:hypothetical protein